ncbi:MAG TPA: HNH endonuclease signature motif containing protein, partial [Candidatus Krumholzibacteria bacterium]|nr:HNH endonuclease signature motif containing protein [Candidatus Krumholzibacteria bacterium]
PPALGCSRNSTGGVLMITSSRSAREVLFETDQIVAQDRKLTLRLLINLHDIERNKFYLELGYGSMFDYCTGHLKYPDGAAVRRIRTARCLAQHPQLMPLLESGEVNPTTVAAVYKHITPENAEAVIDAIKGKSTREVERFIAALQPLSVIPPDRSRPVVVPIVECVKITTGAGGKKSSSVDESTPAAPIVVEHEVRQFKRMVRSEFTVEEETMQKLDRVRSLASHRLSMGTSLGQLIDFMADYFLKREDPIQREARREQRTTITRALAPTSNNPRQIPAAVHDQVFARDQRCTYVGPDGKRCNSTHVLQVDHIRPVARRGASVIENLRLLCAGHNRLESERLMGKRHVIRESRASYAVA